MTDKNIEKTGKGTRETDKFVVNISQPRGNWDVHYCSVTTNDSVGGGIVVLMCELTTENIKQLKGDSDTSVGTSAYVYSIIEAAASDFTELEKSFAELEGATW